MAPVLVGTGLAIGSEPFRLDLFAAMMTASILIQAVANMLNEYYDFKRGLDTHEMVGIAGTIVRDGVRPETVKSIAWATLAASVAIGVYICAQSSWWVAAAGIGSMTVMYLYSGGPWPLSYTPLGELAAGIAMGPVIVVISFFIQSGTVTPRSLLVSIPIGLLIAAILLSNNIRDIEHDRLGGRSTLPILLGAETAVSVLEGVYTLAGLLVAAYALSGVLTPWTLIALAFYPAAIRSAKHFRLHTEGVHRHKGVKGASAALLRFSALLFVGLILGSMTGAAP